MGLAKFSGNVNAKIAEAAAALKAEKPKNAAGAAALAVRLGLKSEANVAARAEKAAANKARKAAAKAALFDPKGKEMGKGKGAGGKTAKKAKGKGAANSSSSSSSNSD